MTEEEIKKCSRCGRKLTLLDGQNRTCNSCRAYQQQYRQRHRKVRLTKSMKEEIIRAQKEKLGILSSKYGTTNENCLLWRSCYESGRRYDDFYNHIDTCFACKSWMMKHKKDSLDLNAVGDNKEKEEEYPELKGYGEAFGHSNEDFPEDYVRHPTGGIWEMQRICSTCGSELRPDGSCPVCNP